MVCVGDDVDEKYKTYIQHNGYWCNNNTHTFATNTDKYVHRNRTNAYNSSDHNNNNNANGNNNNNM